MLLLLFRKYCCAHFTGEQRIFDFTFRVTDSHYDFSLQHWSRQIVASKVWVFFFPPSPWRSVWLILTASVQTSVSSLCSDVGLQYGTTHFRDDKDFWLCFPPLCESNVTIRTQHWRATCPWAYVAFSLFKKPKGSSVAFLENFSGITATFVASRSCKSSTFNWCLFWALEAATMAGRQLESYENGSAKLRFSRIFLSELCPSLFTRASSSHAEALLWTLTICLYLFPVK